MVSNWKPMARPGSNKSSLRNRRVRLFRFFFLHRKAIPMKYFSYLITLSFYLLLTGNTKTQAQTTYTIQDLGTLGGIPTVTGLNNKGEVTAQYFDNVSRYKYSL